MPRSFKKEEKLEIIGLASQAHAGDLKWLDKGICGAGYVHSFDRFSASEVCIVMDISRSCLGQWVSEGCPRNVGHQTYDISAVIKWRRERDNKNGKKSGPNAVEMDDAMAEYAAILEEAGVNDLDDNTDKFLHQGQSFYQELGRKRAAEIALTKRDVLRGNLIPAEEVLSSGVQIGSRLRAHFELAGRRFGRKVGNFLLTGLKEIMKEFEGKTSK